MVRDDVPEPTASAVVASEMSIASSIFAILGGRLGAVGEEGGSRPRVAMGGLLPEEGPGDGAHGRAGGITRNAVRSQRFKRKG